MTLSPGLRPAVTTQLSPYGAVGDDLAPLGLVARPDHIHERIAADVALHRLLRHQEAPLVDRLGEKRPDEHAGQQHALRIGEARAQRHRAGALVDDHLGELDRARVAVVAAVLELQAHLRAAGVTPPAASARRKRQRSALDCWMST